MKNIAILLPAYNEEITIRETIIRFHEQIPEAAIYVINNNSSDNTSGIANEALLYTGCSGKVLFEKRQGEANAIRKAFSEIDSSIYENSEVWFDDFSFFGGN